MSSQEFILYEVKGKLATITINRPDKANAVNIEMLKTIHKKLHEADENERVNCILIRSTGDRFFSAGYDLKEVMGNPENMAKVKEWGRKINESVLLLKKPVITQVQGIAIGFGVLLILASDLRVFADKPKEELYLRLPEIEIMAFPQTGATLLPLLAFGMSYAKNLLFTTDKVGVEELKNINFPTRIFPSNKLDEETLSFSKKLSKYQMEFLFTMKSMLAIMNKAYIKSCFDLEDECGIYASPPKKSMKEWHEFIKELHKKYP